MSEIKKMRPGMRDFSQGADEEMDDDERLAEKLLKEETGASGQAEDIRHLRRDGQAKSDASDVEDIYRVYMEEIAAITPCSEEENKTLLIEIKNGNTAVRNRLIEGNLKRALLLVSEFINRGVAMVDLIQEASIELMLLADEGFEDGFEKLLESRIRVRLEEVVKENEDVRTVEDEVLARVNVLQEVSKRMAEELGREATLEELSARMKMSEEEVKEIMKVTMDALRLSEANRSLQS